MLKYLLFLIPGLDRTDTKNTGAFVELVNLKLLCSNWYASICFFELVCMDLIVQLTFAALHLIKHESDLPYGNTYIYINIYKSIDI